MLARSTGTSDIAPGMSGSDGLPDRRLGTIIHSDHGTAQCASWVFTGRVQEAGLALSNLPRFRDTRHHDGV